ncbi:hypothetical protein D3C78_427990 [compost metagenome]
MADIDARVTGIQNNINELIARVNKGETLSREEAQAIIECRKLFDQLKLADTHKEILRGTNLKSLTDKWA